MYKSLDFPSLKKEQRKVKNGLIQLGIKKKERQFIALDSSHINKSSTKLSTSNVLKSNYQNQVSAEQSKKQENTKNQTKNQIFQSNRVQRFKVYNIGSLISTDKDEEIYHCPNCICKLTLNPKSYNQTISTNSSFKNHQLKINDFQLGKILGIGKFGQVFMARHIKSGFICALKQIKIHSLDSTLRNQLIRQIKIQMHLDHPNIVKMYTFLHDSSSIYLMLELCSSGQLYTFLKQHKPIKENIAKVIIKQICQGIDYLHENKIIHRDIKPQNILFHNNMVKISDFGWSVASTLMRETFCGTPLYVSPQLLKKRYYDHKVDTWSLGILSYQILVGQVPFEIFCQSDYSKIIKNQIKFPNFLSISDQAKNFIRCCLEKDYQKRLSISQLLEHSFIKNVELTNFAQLY